MADLIQSLGDGLRKVNQAANGIGSVVDIADSTKQYSEQVSAAAEKLQNINTLYEDQINLLLSKLMRLKEWQLI